MRLLCEAEFREILHGVVLRVGSGKLNSMKYPMVTPQAVLYISRATNRQLCVIFGGILSLDAVLNKAYGKLQGSVTKTELKGKLAH